MKKLNCALTMSALLILVGCGTSKDYTPPAGASGETIFSSACTECHKPISANVAMVLSEKVANKEAIIKKFQSGSMRMPAFKNIQGEAADRLAEYVLTNSQVNK
ncbi:cytochrome c551 [Nitrosomonas sp. Nm84]|uniref:c-type cytochrome n=1 Tax=Nitrosomonas sp. Nm84 TaxID=200124 RepID=UPI000D754F82|nr:cytochrome c [Nitrosomonas sp. Nm84]PXW86906.1 cytochrome c551 [Nitrosomonas sp. Nm84]